MIEWQNLMVFGRMTGKIPLILLIMGLTFCFADDKKDKEKERIEKKRSFCGILHQCDLPVPEGQCTPEFLKGHPDVDYNEERCSEARLLHKRGYQATSPGGFQFYKWLGMEYRVEYKITDELPISVEQLSFLLNELPLAARLLNHYEKTEYSAKYLEGYGKRYFKGRKGENLRGQARLLSGSTDEEQLYYFGFGIAKVGLWRLKGYAFMDIEFKKVQGNQMGYQMKILVFPGNAFINMIMTMGVFRKIAHGKISDVLTDISNASRKLAAEKGKSILKEDEWSKEEKEKILEFLKLP